MISIVFFDFDGVVIDSEPIHTKAKALALDAYNIEYPADIFDKYKGVPVDKFFIHVSERIDPQHRPYELFLKKRHECLAKLLPDIQIIEGFLEFIEYIKNKGIRTALVTSSTNQELINIDKYLNITSLFDKVISAELTVQHKPDPAPYLKALEVMQANKENVMVIEDSPNGIISGKRAGCRVYALTTTFSKDELIIAGADMIFEGYEQFKNEL